MSDVNLGRTIEKIIGKITREKDKDTSEKPEALPEKVFLKAIPLNDFSDVDVVKHEVNSGNILIIKVSPLAKKNVEDVKRVISELCEFVNAIEGDIARLGEERIVVTPASIKIWREKPDTAGPP